MLPLLALLLVEMLLLVGGLLVGGVIGQLDRNAESILSKQVQNRNNYLEASMVDNWSDLTMLASQVNSVTQRMLDAGELSLDALDSDSNACSPLLLQLCDDLISNLYAKKVSGIFIVFNTHDLAAEQANGQLFYKTGICIRDNDPTAPPSSYRADLLLERAPIDVVQALNISTDTGWYPLYPFNSNGKNTYHDFLYQPFQAAYTAQTVSDPADFGYWSTSPYTLYGTTAATVSYSIPLVLEDGTVYGVLGVELLVSYLREQLPSAELLDNKQGAYLLAVGSEEAGDLHFSPVLLNGATLQQCSLQDSITLRPTRHGGHTFVLDDHEYYASLDYLSLYNSNAPFSGQRWALIGAVRTNHLYVFSHHVTTLLIFTGIITLLAGVAGSFLISRRLSDSIRSLSQEVDRAQRDNGTIPHLPSTGITEIDRFSGAITDLSRDVVNASTRFLRIMEMASVELGGFELRLDEEKLYITDNFFQLLGRPDLDPAQITPQQFLALRSTLQLELVSGSVESGSRVFRIPLPQGGLRYVRVEITPIEDRLVGLAEDVTSATLEKMRIEHERDYDLLTGLLNRRAFYRELETRFQTPEALRHAAVLMLDLDNLKSINDRFGHDWGDQYIRRAGQCLFNSVPGGTLCARVSGDEFFLVFTGYEDQNAIRSAIAALRSAIHSSEFRLPSGEISHVCASGGVAWYPEDSTDFHELIKFADFAMYQMKQTQKGLVGDFDLGVYNRESYLTQSRREFAQLLNEELLHYHFQPIVSARTGQPYAYEALMRVNLPTLRSPDAVLKLARAQGRLADIERLTWFQGNKAYQALLDAGHVAPEALLFINSIANQCLNQEEQDALSALYGARLQRVVIEITEGEDMDPALTHIKRHAFGHANMLALDDYGSGYNSEKNLLELSPQFIKVDISIVRDIDKDTNKQSIVSNIVGYAHARDMLIIAEGIETATEAETVLKLGVDLLQGYFLARPGEVPPDISPAAAALIAQYWTCHTYPPS